MRRVRMITIGVLVALLALAVTAASGQDDGVTLTYDPDHAIIEHGERGAWDGQYTDPGAAIYYEGQFHVFRNGFVGFPAWAGAAYHTSPDGVTWTQHGDEPVFSTDDVPFAEVGAYVASVLVEDDRTWVLYFYTVGSQTTDTAAYTIGRATASDPIGPWTAYPEPVLTPGPADSWDTRVSVPSVVRTADGYTMYFDGVDVHGKYLIGMATSPDGITWTKYDDPTTTKPPFADSDPVFVTGERGTWDATFVRQPSVVQTAQGWLISYKSQAIIGSTRDQAYGFATSQDGVHLTRYSGNPILIKGDVQNRNLWFHELVNADGQLVLLFEMARGYMNETDIYMARVEGSPFE